MPDEIWNTLQEGFFVLTDDRELRWWEWAAVRVFRRPDPRVSVYPISAGDGGEGQRFTISPV